MEKSLCSCPQCTTRHDHLHALIDSKNVLVLPAVAVLTIKAFCYRSEKLLIKKMAVVTYPGIMDLRSFIQENMKDVSPPLLSFCADRDIKLVTTMCDTDAFALLDLPISMLLDNIVNPPPPVIIVTIDAEIEEKIIDPNLNKEFVTSQPPGVNSGKLPVDPESVSNIEINVWEIIRRDNNRMDDIGGGNIGLNGNVMSQKELEETRKRQGKCPKCGQKCFEKKGFTSKPINVPGKVQYGRCLLCNIEDRPGTKTDEITEDNCTGNRAILSATEFDPISYEKSDENKGKKLLSFSVPSGFRSAPWNRRCSERKGPPLFQPGNMLSDGHVVDQSKMTNQWRKAGLCLECGLMKTHKVYALGTVRVPQTVPHKSYKGKCLNCMSMTEARLALSEPTNSFDIRGTLDRHSNNNNEDTFPPFPHHESYLDKRVLLDNQDSSEESDIEYGEEMEGDENAASTKGAVWRDPDSFNDRRQEQRIASVYGNNDRDDSPPLFETDRQNSGRHVSPHKYLWLDDNPKMERIPLFRKLSNDEASASAQEEEPDPLAALVVCLGCNSAQAVEEKQKSRLWRRLGPPRHELEQGMAAMAAGGAEGQYGNDSVDYQGQYGNERGGYQENQHRQTTPSMSLPSDPYNGAPTLLASRRWHQYGASMPPMHRNGADDIQFFDEAEQVLSEDEFDSDDRHASILCYEACGDDRTASILPGEDALGPEIEVIDTGIKLGDYSTVVGENLGSNKNEKIMLAGNETLTSSLHRLTLRTMIENEIREKNSSLLFSDSKKMIVAVTVDQTDAFDLLDFPLSLWMSPADCADLPRIVVSVKREEQRCIW